MLNAAMLSKWHVHAPGYANQLKNSGKVDIKAVWDDNIERGSKWAAELGAEFEPDLAKLLAREDIEAVFVDTPTTAHKDVIIAAAKAGKHIFTEKALCPTVAECLEVKKAVEEAGVIFTISYPERFYPIFQFAKQMIDMGAFGTISTIRRRKAHSGVSGHWLPGYWFEEKDAAGGAMMDLGCHPMYDLAYFGGKVKRVAGMFNAPLGSKVDENAVAVMEFENGIIGIAETGFMSYACPDVFEIYGTEGTLIYHGDQVRFRSSKLAPFTNDWIKPTLPKGGTAPILQFVDACIGKTGAPALCTIDDAIDLTRLLENAYIADRTNTIVTL
ncbi:MAG: Gfo/Idh/MocA family oxidoreductase [Ruminococcaceae bacterium]|nr:Gfo/Idh/MocA family oxidoreductase [Oscillospiraceae bacterium]